MTTSNGEEVSGTDGALTAEQALEAMRLAESGDTSVLALDFGGAPSAAPGAAVNGNDGKATEDETKKAGADGATAGDAKPGASGIPEDQQNADNTVVLAKDGKHTIGYDKLVEARQRANDATTQLQQAQAELATLREAAAKREAQGAAPTNMDNLTAKADEAIAAGVNPEVFGDFSESAMVNGFMTLMNREVPALVEKLVSAKLAPYQQREAKTAEEAHETAIFGKYPNALSIVESTEFGAWVQTQPKVAQASIWATFDPEKGGTADEIVDLLDSYTKATGAQTNPQPAAGAQATAAQAAAVALREPPASLTSIPGARAGATIQDQMVDMGGVDLYQAMENMTPAQIEAHLNRQL